MNRGIWVRSLWLLQLLWIGMSPLAADGQPGSANPVFMRWKSQLQVRIEDPRFERAQWGIKVVSLDTGQTLFEHNAHKFFQPASNAKLFTAALVLDQLGPDYRIRTPIGASSLPDQHGVIHGDVCVHGQGDPTFRSEGQVEAPDHTLQSLVGIFTNARVRRIDGDLIGDAGFLDGVRYGTGWMWEDLQHAYGSPLSGLSLNGNSLRLRVTPAAQPGAPCEVTFLQACGRLQVVNHSLTVTAEPSQTLSARRPLDTDTVIVSGELSVGSEQAVLAVPVAAPAQVFMNQLADSLRRQGIALRGEIRVGPPPATETIFGSVESPPAAEMVREMMKCSDNLTASLLFAQVGMHAHSTPAGDPPEAAGSRVLNQFLLKAGLPCQEVQIEEGSGLSRNSLTTPNALVALLCYMRAHDAASDFIRALPVAGVDGTLAKQFVGTPVQGNLRAKTGTLRWAHALSGYVESQAGEPLAFSILLDRYQPADSNPTATEEVEAVALLLAELSVRSDGS